MSPIITRVRLILLLVVIYTGCSKSDEHQYRLNKFLKDNTSVTTFRFVHNEDKEIVGANGTKIYIPRECFTKKDGDSIDPGDTITVFFKDVLTPSEIIFEGLNTMADDGLLETSGMINLLAVRGEDTLIVNPNKFIKVEFKNVFKGETNDANLFLGNLSQNEFYWSIIPPEQLGGILLWKEYIYNIKKYSDYVILEGSFINGIDTTLWKDNKALDIKIADTVFEAYYRSLNNITLDEAMQLDPDSLYKISSQTEYDDTVATNEAYVGEIKPRYVFMIQDLDWINLDYFVDDTSATLTISNLPGKTYNKYLIFEDINSVFPIYDDEPNIKGLPSGQKCKLLVFGYDGSNLKYDLISIKTGSNTHKNISLKKIEEAELLKIIKSLDKII